jgi:hypothetical protein
MLTQTRKILSKMYHSEGLVVFAQFDDDTSEIRCSTTLVEQDWEDMGRPEQITIAVEPGDKLNVHSA